MSIDSHAAPSSELKVVAALTSINAMFGGSHFSICTIDRAAKLLAVHVERDAYDILHALHCVRWSEMPADLRAAIPGLVKQALCQGGDAFRFTAPDISAGQVVAVDQESAAPFVAEQVSQQSGRRPLLQRLMHR